MDLDEIEEIALKNQDNVLTRYLTTVVSKVRELDHELKNPNYLYAGGRIHRQAVICRDEELKRLRKQITELTKDLPCKQAPEGWTCTRKYGHPGPCAAEPNVQPPKPVS